MKKILFMLLIINILEANQYYTFDKGERFLVLNDGCRNYKVSERNYNQKRYNMKNKKDDYYVEILLGSYHAGFEYLKKYGYKLNENNFGVFYNKALDDQRYAYIGVGAYYNSFYEISYTLKMTYKFFEHIDFGAAISTGYDGYKEKTLNGHIPDDSYDEKGKKTGRLSFFENVIPQVFIGLTMFGAKINMLPSEHGLVFTYGLEF